MNALALSSSYDQQPEPASNEYGLYQARPSHAHKLHYAQELTADLRPLNAPPREDNSAALDQRRAFDAPLQKRLWQPTPAQNPTNAEHAPARPSRIEALYSARIIEPLEQFGYDFLQNNQNPTTAAPPLGLVNDNYILGVGDTLSIALTGQRNAHYQIKLDSNGQIQIPSLPPFNAAGQSLANLKAQIRAEFAGDYNQAIYVALSEMRQRSILITGHVKRPGRITLSNQHNVIDALMQAGGIEKTGSLRQIHVMRNGQETRFDLYSLLLRGPEIVDLSLKDGDRLVVPPLGPTLAISGGVKRPAIYEIRPEAQGNQSLALNDLLDMSGGLLFPGKIRYLKLDMQPDGDEQVSEIDNPLAPLFSDGSILSVLRGAERREGIVEVRGHARADGLHSLSTNKTLAQLIKSDRVFGKDIYPLIAVIERWNRQSLSPEYLNFSPLRVLHGQYDEDLHDGDVIYFFSHLQIAQINADAPDSYQNEDNQDASANNAEDNTPIAEELISLLKERSVFVRGAVRRKGHYPIAQGATLQNILAVAGGVTLEADKKNIEITRRAATPESALYAELSKAKRRVVDLSHSDARNIAVEPGNTIRVNQRFQKNTDNHVQIIGEVNNPGRYDLMAGDTMLSLIQRAGGFSQYAYAEGAIFSRKSERQIEAMRYKSQARSLEMSLASKIQSDEPPNDTQINMTRQLIQQLNNTETIGRITLEADPKILASHPELNMLLERGDRIYIPKRPLTVRVTGEVLSPSALQFRTDKAARRYVQEAGGYTRSADKERAFVVYPDGSAQPLQLGNWTHSAPFIPPGSTIIVPHDPKPFNFLDSAKDITQIFTNLAVTGFLVSEIQND